MPKSVMDTKMLPMLAKAVPPTMSVEDRHFRTLADHLSDGVYIVDRNRQIIYWNDAAERISGFARDEVIGSRCWQDILIHVDEAGERLCRADTCPALTAMRTGEVQEAEVYLHHREGHRVRVPTRVIPIREDGGDVVGAMEIFQDNSAVASFQEQVDSLRRLALLDPLTEVGNRRYIEQSLVGRLDELKRFEWIFGVLFCDIDRFKPFNDRYGHQLGDRVILTVANTMAACVRPFDMVGRWGGDEFLAIITKVESWQLLAIAERLRAQVEASVIDVPYELESLHPTISIGATLARRGDTPDSLLARADKLLYRSKMSGANRVTSNESG